MTWTCDVCRRSFNTARRLAEHLEEKFRDRHPPHARGPYECPACRTAWPSGKTYRGHLATHGAPPPSRG